MSANINSNLRITILAEQKKEENYVQTKITKKLNTNHRISNLITPLQQNWILNDHPFFFMNENLVISYVNMGGDVNFREDFSEHKQTLLIIACTKNQKELVKFLLKMKANVNAVDLLGRSALLYSALFGHRKITKYLVKNKANIHARTPQGKTPLTLANEFHHHEVVDILKKAGALPQLKIPAAFALKPLPF